MSVAFWSVSVSAGKEKAVQPPEGFVLLVTNAALEINDKTKGNVSLSITTESVEGENITATLCTLSADKFPQYSLNIVLGYDVEAKFSSTGNGTVHLSGYYQPAPDGEGDGEFDGEDFDEEDFDDEDDDEEDDDEDDDDDDDEDETDPRVEDLGPVSKEKNAVVKSVPQSAPAKSDAKAAPAPAAKPTKPSTQPASKSINVKDIKKMVADSDEDEEDDEEDDEDSDEDDSEEQSESDDDSEDDMPPLKVQKTQPQGFVKNNNGPKTPQTGNKPAQNPQSGNKNNNNNNNNNNKTPNQKPPQQQPSKTPQSGNKNNNNNNNFNNGPKSGDKRKR